MLFPANAAAKKKMVIVTVNTASLEDLLCNEIIKNAGENGIVGLMNNRSNGKNNQYKPYLTLGSGEKAEVYLECIESYKADDKNKIKFESITLYPCLSGNLVNIYINRLSEINSKTMYGAIPGRLGSMLKANNIKTGFIGGYKSDDSIKSPAFFIAMDSHGIVDSGEIEGLFNDYATDYDKLSMAFLNYNDADFLVAELGDLESLYNERRLYSDESYELRKKEIMDEYGRFIGFVMDNMDFNDSVLCIVSPYSASDRDNANELCPMIIYDGGRTKGVAVSSTTRRIGIVSALDFAPYVLDYFGIKYEGFTGYAIRNHDMEGNVEYIKELNADVTNTSISRAPLLKGYGFLIISILVLYLIVIVRDYRNMYSIIYLLMELCMIAPFSMLIEGAFKFRSTVYKGLFIILASYGIEVLINKLAEQGRVRTVIIGALNIFFLTADVIFGQHMQKSSILSYDAIIGARFYGLGNEYLGVIIGCSLMIGGCIIYKKAFDKIINIMLLFIIVIIGMPYLGANIGGMLTATIGFVVFMLYDKNTNFKRTVLIGILSSAAFLTVCAFLNIGVKGLESHLGKLIIQIYKTGIGYGINIINRKISMALKLIRYTIWSRVFLALIVTSILIFSIPKYFEKLCTYSFVRKNEDMHVLSADKHGDMSMMVKLKKVWVSMLTASCAAILLNDSGIVTAALIMLYALFGTVLMLQPERMG